MPVDQQSWIHGSRWVLCTAYAKAGTFRGSLS